MGLREHLKKLGKEGSLLKIAKPVSKRLEAAGILKTVEPKPVLFENVKDSEFRIMGNLFCSKDSIASYLGISTSEIIPTLSKAIEDRSAPEEVKVAPCQEVVEKTVDLDKVPIVFHNERDGGPYISSAVVVAGHPKYGQNLDFHRAMQIKKDTMSTRVVAKRNFHTFMEDLGTVDVAFCIGNSPNILVAAATSVEIGINELEIANALEPIRVVKAQTSDLLIPADCEWVLEGKVYRDKRHDEGPFIDLTQTYDVIRNEPLFEVTCITHRRDAIWQALLPGAFEHKVLMGMPREPTIFRKINEKGVRCLDVNIDPGGCSWLHAVIQIDKHREEDGKLAIEGAFEGHRSLKHAYIVDKDIDIYDPYDVEWAMATRFQGDVDLVVKEKERGSSLDPSSEPGTYLTTKLGFDLTAPLKVEKGKTFAKASFPQVDLKKYLEE
ncbi:MAG: UbiD family decarboxylase [Candidatus Hermodarchaeota archaeon]|nr:UbiD family decarboxylase [Candidatus Hermodarchaeota archaeon]